LVAGETLFGFPKADIDWDDEVDMRHKRTYGLLRTDGRLAIGVGVVTAGGCTVE